MKDRLMFKYSSENASGKYAPLSEREALESVAESLKSLNKMMDTLIKHIINKEE